MVRPTPYSTHVAVPLPSEESLRSVIGSDFDSAKALNIVQMFAGTEDLYPALIGMVQAIFSAEGIDAQHREVIILRAATVLNVPYEWQANEQMGRNAGLTAEQIDALASDGTVTGIGQEFELLARATDELLTTGTLTDGTLQALLDTFDTVLTRKYIATIAWFSLLSLFLNGTRVPMETTDKIGDRTSPLG